MCGRAGDESHGARLSRRAVLTAAVAAAGAFAMRRVPASARTPETVDLGGVAVLPRATWAGDLSPTGPIAREPEVRYLLVHHSVDPGNGYGEGDVAGILRSFFRFHTQKGWPDLAYNFLVDRFGRVWEGRAGSVEGPVAGDATGGNQGSDQLCCFVGDHQSAGPSPAALASMGRLLAALAHRYAIPVGPDATTVFVSRGSNRHPPGAEVTTLTIAGHRDMSRTQCPGDHVVARLPALRLLAAARSAGLLSSAAPPPPAAPATTAPATTATGTPPTPTTPTTAGSPPTTAAPSSSGAPPTTGATRAASRPAAGDDAVGAATVVAGGVAAAVAAATAGVVRRRRTSSTSLLPPPSPPPP